MAHFIYLYMVYKMLSPQYFEQHNLHTIKNILILGDSHLVGDFGEYLHLGLHQNYNCDITSIAIAGAGSMHYVLTMTNFCCGYKIRQSCANDTLSYGKIKVIESKGYGDSSIVAPQYGGKLKLFLPSVNPDLVLLVLGSNYTNAHQELIEIIRAYNQKIPIIWIGPFMRANIAMRLNLIKPVVKYNKNVHLIRSDDIIGNDSIMMFHFDGKSAREWANKVVERMFQIIK